MFVPLVFAGMLPRKRGTEGAHGDGNEEGATSTHRATLEEGPRDLTWRQRGKERPGLGE